MSRIPFDTLAAGALAVAILAAPRAARAEDECPPGAKYKTEGEFKWCEPSICETDAQCGTGEICRPVALCVQIGRVESKPGQDAGARLITTQRCGADQECPNTTVCTEKNRCVSRAQADKMSGLTVKAQPANSAAPGGAETAKKSCGCRTVGSRDPGLGALALSAGALALAASRRSRRLRR